MSFFRRGRTHEDFSHEIQAHIDLETDRLVDDGWPVDRARDEARRAFGNVTRVRERFYEASRWMWFDQFAQDVRYAWRSLRHSPAFLTTTVLTLTVSIGMITVAFTVFNAYVLRPYAVRDPASLYQVGWRSQTSGAGSFRWRDYQELRDRRDVFGALIAESTRFVTSNGRPLAAALVSDNYFDVLGPRVLLGRTLGGGAADAVVLSEQGWSRLFARDPAVVGRDLDVNGRRFSIVGVLRPEFTGLSDTPRDVWLSLAAYAPIGSPDLIGSDGRRAVELTGRLQSGVSREQAQLALTPLMKRIAEAPPGEAVRAEVQPASPNPLTLEMLALLSPIFAAFALVLATACANVSNVMLARAVVRHREIAVRLALGASRGRVVRQLVTEGLVISLIAGVAALALAGFVLRGAVAMFFGTLPPSVAAILRLVPLGIDHRVFLFALGTAVAATVLFALLPALQASRLSLIAAVRGQGGSVRHGSKLRSGLVVGQVAVSLILVIVAATLARNGAAIGALDLGYESTGVLSVNVRGERDDLIRRLAPVLASDPRVAEVAATGGNPLFIRTRSIAASAAGSSTAIATRYTFVGPEYFPLLRIPIARGRAFRQDEAQASARVAIVSAATARAFWPGADPIGQAIRIERPNGRPVEDLPGYDNLTVIGTAPDVVSGLIVDGPDAGHIYLPTSTQSVHATALLVRARAARDLGPDALQELFRRVGTDPEVFEALPLGEMRALQIYPLQAASWVGFVLGALALVLSVTGLYGVLSYTLSQRVREIGIRIALGATGAAVVGLIMRQTARLAVTGCTVGLAVAYGALKILNAVVRLQTVSLLDTAAFAAGLLLVLGAAAVAAYHPAVRATRIDPSEALRVDA